MKRRREILLVAAALVFLPVLGPLPAMLSDGSRGVYSRAHAVQPDEVLADGVLERRARALSAGLRCLVCQNQSIDDSDAELAKDLRVLVRERLVAGDSDKDVTDYIVARYGEFVLLKPRLSAGTILLWAAPVALLAVGAAIAAIGQRGRGRGIRTARLTEDEEIAVERALRKKGL